MIDPLCSAFPLTHVWYYSIDFEGNYTCIGSCHSWMEYFFEKKLYISLSAFFRNPIYYQNTKVLSRASEEGLDRVIDKDIPCHLNTSLVLLEKDSQGIGGFGFATTESGRAIENLFLNELPILQKFSRYFQKEGRQMIFQRKAEPLSMKKMIGEAVFAENPNLLGELNQKKRASLLQKLGMIPFTPLSPQEEKCLSFALRGKSSSQIGRELGLSSRTIEHYMESIKNKFGCSNKAELFDRVDPTVF